MGVEGLADDDVVEQGVVALGMHRAPLVQDLVELVLLIALLLASRVALYGPDDIVWLALVNRVPLASVIGVIIVSPPVVVIVAAREVITLLLLFRWPTAASCHGA